MFVYHVSCIIAPLGRLPRGVACWKSHHDIIIVSSSLLHARTIKMPPKKQVEEEVLGPWSLGRFSSNLKVRARRREANERTNESRRLRAGNEMIRAIFPARYDLERSFER